MGRITASRKQLVGDPQHNSVLASKFINCLMLDGAKSTAQRIFYDALKILGEKVSIVSDKPQTTRTQVRGVAI